MMDLSSSMVTLGARQVRAVLGETVSHEMLGTALRVLRQSAEVAKAALPAEVGVEWRELANKLAAFDNFQQVRDDGLPLAEQLRRAAALGSAGCTWVTEGLGHARAARGLPVGDPRSRLPGRAVLPLHTGAALWFAERWLELERPGSPQRLARWIGRWEEVARPGCRGLLVEALGLVARNLCPHLVGGLAEMLRDLDPVFPEYLWHGVGRGLYFTPTHAAPYSGAHRRALEKVWQEPPDEPGRRNATAGLAWALTLVNFRHPEVLADVLRRQSGAIGCREGFANGVASAALVWRETVGEGADLVGFLRYRPGGPGSTLAAVWSELVLDPCQEALRQPAGGLGSRLDDLFRCPPTARRELSVASSGSPVLQGGPPPVRPLEGGTPRAKNLADGAVQLVSYTLVSLLPCAERVLPEGFGLVLVTIPMSGESFVAWIVARYVQSGGTIEPAERRYLRVAYEVLHRWPAEPHSGCHEGKVRALADIHGAITHLGETQ